MAVQNLSLTRGDTASYLVSATYEDGSMRTFVSGDKVYFTVKRDTETPEILVQKVITEFTAEGKAIVTLDSIDTKSIAYGSYKYDIQLTTSTGIVQTIIKPSTFKLTTEVTFE